MIRSRQNSRLKDIRRLRRSKGDRALLEGPHLIEEAIDQGLALGDVLVTPEFLKSDACRNLERRLLNPPLEVDPRLLDEIAESDSPRGIVGTVHLSRGGVATLPIAENGIYLFLEGIQDPGNLGALVRAAEGSGAVGIGLGAGSVHPNHPRAIRASAGSLLRLPVALSTCQEELEEHLAPLEPRSAALIPHGGSDFYGASFRGCFILLIGAEGPGLSEVARRRAHLELTIPIESPVESLNLTVAAAIALFEIRRQRRQLNSDGL